MEITRPIPRSHEVELAIRDYERRQDGLIRADQLEEIGLTSSAVSKRVRAGRMRRVRRGVYTRSFAPLSPEAHWRAAVVAAGPGVVLSGEAAADLWLMTRRPSSTITVLTPHGPNVLADVRVKRTRSLPAEEQGTRRGIPVTNPARTIVEYSFDADPYDTVGLLHEAAYRERFDRDHVEAIWRRIRNQPGGWKLGFAIEQHLAGSQGVYSRDERYLLRLYQEAGIELPYVNVLTDTPRSPYLVDQIWPHRGCVVELDGAGHARPSARARDVDRTLAIVETGNRLLRIPNALIYAEPNRVLDAVRSLLAGTVVRL